MKDLTCIKSIECSFVLFFLLLSLEDIEEREKRERDGQSDRVLAIHCLPQKKRSMWLSIGDSKVLKQRNSLSSLSFLFDD